MATLNEGIAKIEPGSTLDIMYRKLLSGMEESSQEKLPDFTGSDYVTIDGDNYIVNEVKINKEIAEYHDITRKNAAFLFADATVNIAGGGGSGGSGSSKFVKLSGDSMLGHLKALYKFTAGDNGVKILDIYQKNNGVSGISNIVEVNGELHLAKEGIFIGSNNILKYQNRTLMLSSESVSIAGNMNVDGEISIGNVVISDTQITNNGHIYYHAGNSNKTNVNWSMLNAHVAGQLEAVGHSLFGDIVVMNKGVLIKFDNQDVLEISNVGNTILRGTLNVVGDGIKLNNDYAIRAKNINIVSFSAPNKQLNLGDDSTLKINLQSGIYNNNGEYEMISTTGGAYFPESFKAGHGLGNVLLSTYKIDTENSGMVVHRYIRFHDSKGVGFFSDGNKLFMEAPFVYVQGDIPVTEHHTTNMGYVASTSLYAPQNKVSFSLQFDTEADFYVFNKPLEGLKSIGISGSKTRILNNQLFFSDNVYLQAIQDGIKHYGNAYLTGDIGSVLFSSGFAGSGWKIYQNKLTGNISATFDELTIRKKMRVYELEVQKNNAVNGSWWISDACSGDIVEELM